MHDQYVLTAVYVDEAVRAEHVVKVTRSESDVVGHDVSPYIGTNWQLWLEHYKVDDNCVVQRREAIKALYPVVNGL